MFNTILWFLVIIHLICALIYSVIILIGRSHLRKEYIIVIFLVPLFGLILAIVIDLLYIFGKPGQKIFEIEAVKLGNDIYWSPLKHTKENADVVPLEESMIINDFQTRRKAMFEIQEHDPVKIMDVLLVARENDDVETVHYATTQISKRQKSFQLELQKAAVELESDPQNLNILDQYIELYDAYLDSGLLEENLLKRQRFIYSELLDKKIYLSGNDRDTLIKKLRNSIQLGNFTDANEINATLKKQWPLDEDTWIEALRTSIESKDQKQLRETLSEIQRTPINWTKPGRERVKYWVDIQS